MSASPPLELAECGGGTRAGFLPSRWRYREGIRLCWWWCWPTTGSLSIPSLPNIRLLRISFISSAATHNFPPFLNSCASGSTTTVMIQLEGQIPSLGGDFTQAEQVPATQSPLSLPTVPIFFLNGTGWYLSVVPTGARSVSEPNKTAPPDLAKSPFLFCSKKSLHNLQFNWGSIVVPWHSQPKPGP